MNIFKERLKDLRTSLSLTQEEFAKRLGISKSAVGMYERGEREPSIKLLAKIADTFNVDVNYLIGSNSQFEDLFKKAGMKELVEQGGKMSQEQLKKWVELMKTYEK